MTEDFYLVKFIRGMPSRSPQKLKGRFILLMMLQHHLEASHLESH